MKHVKSFYKDKHWESKRQAILKRDNYKCRQCSRYGKAIPASAVHHINQLEENPELALIDDNLLSLCDECHNVMHDRINNTLTLLGLQWVARVELKLINIKRNV